MQKAERQRQRAVPGWFAGLLALACRIICAVHGCFVLTQRIGVIHTGTFLDVLVGSPRKGECRRFQFFIVDDISIGVSDRHAKGIFLPVALPRVDGIDVALGGADLPFFRAKVVTRTVFRFFDHAIVFILTLGDFVSITFEFKLFDLVVGVEFDKALLSARLGILG